MLERWNDALVYIESRLDKDLDLSELGRITLTSDYHFRRVFSVLAGMPLSLYIRRRRMTLAAAQVLDGVGILEVARMFGYSSGDAFSRAFREMHGVNPSQARHPGTTLSSQPAVTFHLTIEGSSAMRYRIVDLPQFRVAGKSTRIPLSYSGENARMTEFHQHLPVDVVPRLRELADMTELPEILFVSTGFEPEREDGSLFDYYFAVGTTAPLGDLEDWNVLDVAASKWAVFEARSESGLQVALQQLWSDAFGEWFPSNPYQVVPGPEILTVTEKSEDWSSGVGELWIPVERTADAR